MESYERFLEFVKRSNAVSPTVAMETANALQVISTTTVLTLFFKQSYFGSSCFGTFTTMACIIGPSIYEKCFF